MDDNKISKLKTFDFETETEITSSTQRYASQPPGLMPIKEMCATVHACFVDLSMKI